MLQIVFDLRKSSLENSGRQKGAQWGNCKILTPGHNAGQEKFEFLSSWECGTGCSNRQLLA